MRGCREGVLAIAGDLSRPAVTLGACPHGYLVEGTEEPVVHH